MDVAELPAAVAAFGSAGKKTGLVEAMPGGVHTNFMPGGGHDGEIRSERIDAQIVTPAKLDLLDGAREIWNCRRYRRAVGEHQMTFIGHEKCGDVGEVFAPGGGAFLGDVVSDGLGEGADVGFNRGGALWGEGLRVAGDGAVCAAANRGKDCDEQGAL